MGVSTTHRINLSMWILIYSFSDTYYVWAACDDYRPNWTPLSPITITNNREYVLLIHEILAANLYTGSKGVMCDLDCS